MRGEKKVTKKTLKLENGLVVSGAVLLTPKEAEKLPAGVLRFGQRWILQPDNERSKQIPYVDTDGMIYTEYDSALNERYGARPALLISNFNNTNLAIGDVFHFGNENFEILSNNIALCLSIIEPFLFYDYDMPEESVDTCDLQRCLQIWYTKMWYIQAVEQKDNNLENQIEVISLGDNAKGVSAIRCYYPDFNLIRVIFPNGAKIEKEEYEEIDDFLSVTIQDNITEIGSWCFFGCENLVEVIISDSVKKIESSAFRDCWSLTNVKLPKYIKEISNGMFYNCYNLRNIIIPDGVTRIKNTAFMYCRSLSNIIIPETVTVIGDMAFDDCSGLTSITIPDSVTEIGNGAFSGCTKLSNIKIPDSVTTMGDGAFHNCPNLLCVTLPHNAPIWWEYCFPETAKIIRAPKIKESEKE